RQQDRAATHANRGLIYFTLGNPAAAERDYTAALALNPPADQRAALLLNRGNLHFVRQNYQKALADYDQALKLGLSQTQIPHFNRGLALAQLNQPDAALAAYRAALAALPGWPPAQQKIAQLQSAPPPQ
ncbi:MAG: tetratricopeptide repeat protein, partial [Cellvibrionales bacterium]|nr:tetratricopeptide repeat protein [Cellvibrionales bacterium]